MDIRDKTIMDLVKKNCDNIAEMNKGISSLGKQVAVITEKVGNIEDTTRRIEKEHSETIKDHESRIRKVEAVKWVSDIGIKLLMLAITAVTGAIIFTVIKQ